MTNDNYDFDFGDMLPDDMTGVPEIPAENVFADASAVDVDAVASTTYATNGGYDAILHLDEQRQVLGAYMVALCTPDEAALAMRGGCLDVPAVDADGCRQVSDWGAEVTGEELRERLEFYFGVTEARRVLASITANN